MIDKQAEALELAELFESWAKIRGESESGSSTRAARELRRLHARVVEVEEALVAEAARTAEQKLRADQMSKQHDTQAALNREARHKLAQLEAAQAAPGWKVTEEMHVAAVKVLQRASGLDGLPQRMLDAMLAAAPTPPAQERKPLTDEQIDALWGGENVSVPQLVNRRAISRSIERAHGIGVEKK